MGTRHLIMVMLDGQYKVAQYGQWDGYPEGQGVKVLDFLRSHNVEVFKSQVRKVRYLAPEEVERESRTNYCGDHDEFSRDTSAGILPLIYSGEVSILHNQEDFIKDSLMCEWAYVIDLDKNTFETYRGFNKSPLNERARFYYGGKQDGGYYPCSLVRSFHFTQLPTDEYFLKETQDKEE
jgi:hypothetical protein